MDGSEGESSRKCHYLKAICMKYKKPILLYMLNCRKDGDYKYWIMPLVFIVVERQRNRRCSGSLPTPPLQWLKPGPPNSVQISPKYRGVMCCSPGGTWVRSWIKSTGARQDQELWDSQPQCQVPACVQQDGKSQERDTWRVMDSEGVQTSEVKP